MHQSEDWAKDEAGQANQSQTLRQIRNEGEESQHPGPPPGLEGNRSTGQREEAWHRHGEAERHQEAVSQRERSGSIFQRPDELLDVQGASKAGGVQGEMGRYSCKVR